MIKFLCVIGASYPISMVNQFSNLVYNVHVIILEVFALVDTDNK
jgi:hypothetical protein